jgi:hypothetical protein
VTFSRVVALAALTFASAACTPPPPPPRDDLDLVLNLDWRWTDGAGSACPSGPTRFDGGLHLEPGQPAQQIIAATRTDVDGDGDDDHAFLVTCGDDSMVAAFTRAGKAYVALGGPVVTTTRPIGALSGVERAPAGVRVRVADRCCVDRRNTALRQWRTYVRDGGAYRQTAGPTTFAADADKARVTTTVPEVRFGPRRGGRYQATVRITVANAGPARVAGLVVVVDLVAGPAPGGDWARCPAPAPDAAPECRLGSLAPGRSVELRLPVTAGSGVTAADVDVLGHVHVRTHDLKYPDVVVQHRFT